MLGRGRPRRRRPLRGYRRVVAAALLALAAGLTVEALLSPARDLAVVVVAARDLAAGVTLSASDLTSVRMPPAAVPDGAAAAVGELTGATLTSPARRGEPLTDARLGGRGLLTAAPEGTLAVPVRVGEPAVLELVGPGDRVAVLAGPDLDSVGAGGTLLVPRAVVLSVPASTGGGLLGAADTAGAVVVLALDRAEATRVAGALGQRMLTLGLLP